MNSEGQVVHSDPGSVNGRNMLQDRKQHTIGEDAVIPPPSAADESAEKDRAEKRKKKK